MKKWNIKVYYQCKRKYSGIGRRAAVRYEQPYGKVRQTQKEIK